MKIQELIIGSRENSKLVHYKDVKNFANTVPYSSLDKTVIGGVLKANLHVDGTLYQAYSKKDQHTMVIAATRLGKTTCYVIPTLISLAKQPLKRSFIISDPKGEIYRTCSKTLKECGYLIRKLDFRNYRASEGWNPLTPIYRKYMQWVHFGDQVEVVDVDGVPKNRFMGKIYDDQLELDTAIDMERRVILDDVYNDLDTFCAMVVVTKSQRDPTWEDGARDTLNGVLSAMLEDTQNEENPITEDTYSIDTALRIISSFNDDSSDEYDHGYFTKRPHNSRARMLVAGTVLISAKQTRAGYMSTLLSKLSALKDVVTRRITSCNSFELSEMVGEQPVAFFLCYRDEVKTQYQIIALFVQAAYKFLIEYANNMPMGHLDRPVYFFMDEMGNFPEMVDFETVISACAGRNIWFVIVLQSYAQLNKVYGEDTAKIIRDNINVRVFFGSNNPDTLREFSEECGKVTRISPASAMCGKGEEIESCDLETLSLMPISTLSSLKLGEAIVTEANCGYVTYSKLEPYYTCDEFKNMPIAENGEYQCSVNLLDPKYTYEWKFKKRNPFDD